MSKAQKSTAWDLSLETLQEVFCKMMKRYFPNAPRNPLLVLEHEMSLEFMEHRIVLSSDKYSDEMAISIYAFAVNLLDMKIQQLLNKQHENLTSKPKDLKQEGSQAIEMHGTNSKPEIVKESKIFKPNAENTGACLSFIKSPESQENSLTKINFLETQEIELSEISISMSKSSVTKGEIHKKPKSMGHEADKILEGRFSFKSNFQNFYGSPNKREPLAKSTLLESATLFNEKDLIYEGNGTTNEAGWVTPGYVTPDNEKEPEKNIESVHTDLVEDFSAASSTLETMYLQRMDEQKYFEALKNQLKNTENRFISIIRKSCEYYGWEFPEFETVRENDVYKCTALFCSVNFVSGYEYDKIKAKGCACKKIYEYISNSWEKVITHNKNRIYRAQDERENTVF
ncbi:hypothetical protein ENBRE01_0618 [Enteropsectra breve]|nr:hypothetical protein ENBRE01_0618 [Enteropsectra breve]